MTDPRTSIAGDGGAPNIAIDLQPDSADRGDFLLDESELDGPALLAYDAGAGQWLNVVCDVTRVTLRRGATRLQGVLTQSEAGQCTVTARDTNRRLDPVLNSDAIHKGVPFRIRAWGVDGAGQLWEEVLFTGAVDDVAVAYDKIQPPTVTITASDIIARLGGWKSTGYADPGIGAGDNLRTRVGRILNEMGGGLGARISADSDAVYTASLASSNLTDAWPNVTDAQEAELGRVWVNNADQMVIRGRWSELAGPLRGTLSDFHDEIVAGPVHCCYTDPAVVYGQEMLTNRAIASRRVPNTGGTSVPAAVAQVVDEYSGARYDWQTTERRDLELQTDGQLAPWAEALIVSTTEPRLRVDSVRPAPWTAPEAWPYVCATDIGDRWSFRLRPDLGPAIARTIGVLGIEHDITPEEWQITWHTDDAPSPGDNNSSGWFALDVSMLDEGDVLPPFGGKPA